MVDSKKAAYIFPGQGAQYVGMGKGLYETFPEAKEVFEKASEIVGFDLKKLCFEGPKEELTRTANSQVAILTTSIAALRSFISEKKSANLDICASLGLSLGEYTALIAAGAISFEEGLRLVKLRGQFMEEAAIQNPGTMSSIIGLSVDDAEEIAKSTNTEIANLNCPGQVVISGKKEQIEEANRIAKEKGAKRCIMLDVSGAFHSSAMDPARDKLKPEIEKANIRSPKIPVVANHTALFEESPDQIKENLIHQVNHRTRWADSISLVASGGVGIFFEIGPGKVLKGLLRRINSDLTVYNIETPQDVESI
ncbi:MAG: ACP S-malonyltransferase [Candidatus Omnitrophica bacterium]|nr:ACP S-malonyltransferase [Candidatus Omnitrophota bacterium]